MVIDRARQMRLGRPSFMYFWRFNAVLNSEDLSRRQEARSASDRPNIAA